MKWYMLDNSVKTMNIEITNNITLVLLSIQMKNAILDGSHKLGLSHPHKVQLNGESPKSIPSCWVEFCPN